MVSLCIDDCENCITLPPLGQLPCLKDLTVSGMTLVDTIGPEFYGMAVEGSISSFQPFPSLEYLKFKDMPNWTEWLPFESGQLPFARLKTLILVECPELRGHLPTHLSSIEEIEISFCDHLWATTSTLHWLSSIKKISINDVWFTERTQRSSERTQWSLLESDTPCLLQHVRVGYCDSLLSVPKMIVSSTCLVCLVLRDVPSLTAFPTDGLPTSLLRLEIVTCKNLAFLPSETWRNYTSLRELSDSCDALTSFPLDGFPALETLYISDCSSLESISYISESSSLRPSTLKTLHISNCEALRSLPQRMDTLTHLTDLYLIGVPEVELLFCEGACLPPKLRYIDIESVRVPPQDITGWGLQRLTALSRLTIEGDDIVNAMLEGPLLPISLVGLSIESLSYTKSLEGNGLRHLSSLESLQFWDCPMLESLPKDRLPFSLKSLTFIDCPMLESLPNDRLPSSLKSLWFWDCPMLKSLPEDRLPSSLKILSIWSCPLLEKRYESERGEHWSNIAHIPVLKINGQVTKI